MPKNYIDEIVNIARPELIDSRIMVTQIIENPKEKDEKIPSSKSVIINNIYKISSPKVVDYPMRSSIVSESIEDGYEVLPGQEFEKVWTMKNIGKSSWPSDTIFSKASESPIEVNEYHIGGVKQGESVKITIKDKAPTVPGHYVVCLR